jgi:hypothetical protein
VIEKFFGTVCSLIQFFSDEQRIRHSTGHFSIFLEANMSSSCKLAYGDQRPNPQFYLSVKDGRILIEEGFKIHHAAHLHYIVAIEKISDSQATISLTLVS